MCSCIFVFLILVQTGILALIASVTGLFYMFTFNANTCRSKQLNRKSLWAAKSKIYHHCIMSYHMYYCIHKLYLTHTSHQVFKYLIGNILFVKSIDIFLSMQEIVIFQTKIDI